MLAALFLIAPQTDALDLTKEAALQKPISVDITMDTINTAAKKIGKLIDQPVEAVSTMMDRKVTILCKDLPAATIMASVADVMGAQWVKDSGTYRLRIDSQNLKNERDFVSAEDRLLKSRVEDILNASVAKAKETGGVAESANNNQATSTFITGAFKGGGRPIGDGDLLTGVMFTNLPTAQISAFWRGEPITFAPVIPGNQNQAASTNEAGRIAAVYDPYSQAFYRNPGNDKGRGQEDVIPYARPAKPIATMPFAKQVLEWEQKSETADADPNFKKPFTVLPTQRAAQTFSPTPMLADQMEALHNQTGVNIVSDAFRLSFPIIGSQSSGTQFIDNLRDQDYFVKVQNGIFEVRHPAFWRLRRFEIPENVITPFASKANKSALLLTDYAAFFARLKPEQASIFTTETNYDLGFDPQPLRELSGMLTLFNALTAHQRGGAYGQGLAFPNMNQSQQKMFYDTVVRGVATQHGDPSAISALMIRDDQPVFIKIIDEPSNANRSFSVLIGKSGNQLSFQSTALAPAPSKSK